MTNEASGTLPLLVNMIGSVSLLLWGSFTVRSAVERSFASALNTLISKTSGKSAHAVIAGAAAALCMQSATATILLASALLSSGTLSVATAMSVILGADLGSALATRLLYIDLSLLPPLLLFIGLVFHLTSITWRGRYFGRILVGLGLMLLAILWMKQTIAPLTASPLPDDWLSVLRSAPWLAMVVVAGATWFAHSSVAVVLVVAAFAQTLVIPMELAVPMLLGANIGAGCIALPLVGKGNHDARAAVLCNLGIRISLAVILLIAVYGFPQLLNGLPRLGAEPGARVIALHIAFNGLLVLLFMPFSAALAHKIKRRLVEVESSHSPTAMAEAGYGLDPELVHVPEEALASARREALRLGDITEGLFSRALGMFNATDRSQILQLVESDQEINARNKAIHQYLSELRRHISDADQEQQLDQILHFASIMENIGDTVSHDLARLATKRLDRGVMFSSEGQDEILLIHREVLSLLRTEINQFAANNRNAAKKSRRIVEQIRALCNESVSHHRRRLSDHKASSIGTSSIHQDTVRDLLQVALLLEHFFDI